MTARQTNLALLIALAVAFTTGVMAFGTGTGWNRWVTIAHAIAGLLIIVLAPWKSVIVQRGLRRGRGDAWTSVALLSLVVVAIVSGLLHSTGVIGLGGLTSMQAHVGAALLTLPWAIWHVRRRPVRFSSADLSRRRVLRAGTFIAGTAAAYAATEGLFRLTGLPAGSRRFTGSHEQGSFDPDAMPVTQWLNDNVPEIDVERWRFRVGEQSFDYETLVRFEDRLTVTLDCTGGWFSEQEWEGAWLSRLVPDTADARSLVATSVTGYGRRYPIEDLEHLFLATRLGGRPLSPGHGFPLRLVAPGRRGFWWVKWLARVEPSSAAWWWQSPFPLT